MWTLLSHLTTEENWKKEKRRISTSTLLENWKKLRNVKVTIITIVVGAFGSHQRIIKETGGLWNRRRVESIQTTILYWDQPEHWEESWRLEEICYHSNFSKRPSADADVNNNNNTVIIIIIIIIIIIMQKEIHMFGPWERTKNLWAWEMTVIPVVVGALETVPWSFGKRIGTTGNQRKNWDHLD